MEEHLAGEGVVPRVLGRKLVHLLEDVSLAGEPVEQDTAGGHGVLGLGPFLAGIRAWLPAFGPSPDAPGADGR